MLHAQAAHSAASVDYQSVSLSGGAHMDGQVGVRRGEARLRGVEAHMRRGRRRGLGVRGAGRAVSAAGAAKAWPSVIDRSVSRGPNCIRYIYMGRLPPVYWQRPS